MQKRSTNRFSKPVSEIGFGGWQLGNTLWGEMSFKEGVSLVKEAIEQGVNLFDTAPGYGNGNSELIIGEAIKNVRDQVFINTKFGHNADGTSNFDSSFIRTAIQDSLKRLQTTYLDSLILHNPEHYILEGKTDHFQVLEALKKEGLIRGYGVSVDNLHELNLILENLEIDVIEVMFNMIHQEVKEAFEEIKKRGILLIIKVPLDSGWLTGKYNKDSKFTGIRNRWNQEVIGVRADIVKEIQKIIRKQNITEDALRFILSYDAVSSIIPGMKDSEQLQSNIHSANTKMANDTKQQIEQLYLLKIKQAYTPW